MALVVALALGILLALLAKNVLLGDDSDHQPEPQPRTGGAHPRHLASATMPTRPRRATRPSATCSPSAPRRSPAATGQQFLATVDPADAAFYAKQSTLVDRLDALQFADWSYSWPATAPASAADRARVLPDRSVIVRARLTYRLAGTTTSTDREQYLTVVPRGDDWLVACDTDGSAVRPRHPARPLGPGTGARPARRPSLSWPTGAAPPGRRCGSSPTRPTSRCTTSTTSGPASGPAEPVVCCRAARPTWPP